MTIPTSLPRVGMFWLFISALTASAQTPASANAGGKPDEIVQLSEFTVSGAEDQGYLAANASTGSRLNTPIKDLTFNVNVVTSEFLHDFGVLEFDDFSYVSTLNSMDSNGSLNLRGYGVQKVMRNGFTRIGLYDRVNIDRIEIIKGPSAAIYGETRPGGLVNIITKRPRQRPEQDVSFLVGNYETHRADLSTTGPVTKDGKTLYRFDAGWMERDFVQPYAYLNQKTLSGSVVHNWSPTTSLWIEVEWLYRKNNPQSSLPFAVDPTTKKVVGIATNLTRLSQVGSYSEANREVSDITGTFEHRFNGVFSTRQAINYYHRHLRTGNGGTFSNYTLGSATINRGAPGYGRIDEDGGGFQSDWVAHYPLANRAVDSKTLLTFDYSVYNRVDPQWRAISGSSATTPHTVNWDVAHGLYNVTVPIDGSAVFLTPEFTPVNYPRINRWNVNNVSDRGVFLRQQVAAWRNKLIGVVGVRYDSVLYKLTDKQDFMNHTGSIVTQRATQEKTTPMGGINFKARPDVALYVNYSKSFFPDSQNVNAKNPVVSETGYGYDYGTKVSLLDDRVDFTLGGFYIVRENVKVTVVDVNLNNETVYAGTQKAQGLEFDGSYRATDHTQLLLGYSYVDSRFTYFGNDVDTVGRPPPKVPVHQGYLAGKYTFDRGWLRGVAVNLGVRYTGTSYSDPQGGGITNPATKQVDANDGRRNIKTPAYTVVDLAFHYQWKTQRGITQLVSVNFKNLLDKEYITTGRVPGDRFTTYVSYGLRF